MSCERVSRNLSLFLDDVLEQDQAVWVSGHLKQCVDCRRELERLALLRSKLGSLERVRAPDYLRHMVGLRLASARHDTWQARLRDALEYRWSRIRTTEGMWYLTRLMGTVATCILFLFITAATRPVYLQFPPQAHERGGVSQALRQQLPLNVLMKLGLTPREAQKRPISPSEAMISELYLLNYSQNAARTARDDSFSVVTIVDRSGAAKIQDVLEYPADTTLLSDFNDMIQSARCRPASQNGRAIESRMILTFSKISVYD